MKYVALILSLFVAGSAFAQSGIRQNGTVTNFDIMRWRQSQVADDPNNDTTTGRGINPFHIYDQNQCGITLDNKLTTDASNNPLCLGHDSSGNAIATYQGNTYSFPFAASGINGPNPTVNKGLPFWNGTNGTLLGDSKYVFLTPEQFGAAGDCATNDSVAMQNAINAAQAAGGILQLGPKCYLATDLLITARMWLRGSGQGATIIKNPTTGVTSNILKIGWTAPNAAQTQGVQVSDLAFDGNSANSGYAISARHVANTTVMNVYLNQVYWGIEDEQSNGDLYSNISGYTKGTGGCAFKFWADAAAMAAGGRSDQLSIYDVKLNNQYGGNNGFCWAGNANTVNAYNLVMLQSNVGLLVDASLNTVSAFPSFGSFYNLQIEGAQGVGIWIQGGREFNFTDSYCYSFYGQVGSLGVQGNNDQACLAIASDALASVTSSISWKGGSIGGSAQEAIEMQAQGVRISDVTMKAGSFKAPGTYPSVVITNADGLGSADYQFSNVKFCGEYGNAGGYSYGLQLNTNVGQTSVVGSNFNYCDVGKEILDTPKNRFVGVGNVGADLHPMLNWAWNYIDTTTPTASACGTGPVTQGNALVGDVITVADTGNTCHIDFAPNTVASAAGGPMQVMLTSNNPAIPVAPVNITAGGFDITSSVPLTSMIVFWRVSQGTN